MTTYSFQPTSSQNFTFQPTLDGNTYNCTITWNWFGLRYYITCADLSGNIIFTLPLIGSPQSYPISITAGYFDSTLVYFDQTQQIVVTP